MTNQKSIEAAKAEIAAGGGKPFPDQKGHVVGSLDLPLTQVYEADYNVACDLAGVPHGSHIFELCAAHRDRGRAESGHKIGKRDDIAAVNGETDPTLNILAEMGTDPAKWASEFVRLFRVAWDSDLPMSDAEGLMIGWFANAIQAGKSSVETVGDNVRNYVLVEPAEYSKALRKYDTHPFCNFSELLAAAEKYGATAIDHDVANRLKAAQCEAHGKGYDEGYNAASKDFARLCALYNVDPATSALGDLVSAAHAWGLKEGVETNIDNSHTEARNEGYDKGCSEGYARGCADGRDAEARRTNRHVSEAVAETRREMAQARGLVIHKVGEITTVTATEVDGLTIKL